MILFSCLCVKDLYKGTFTTDLLAEDDTTFFNDVEQFMELQHSEANKLIEQHKETADWVELVERVFFFIPLFRTRRR